MNTIKIILGDDHRIVRDGIKALLAKDPLFEIVGEAENGLELITLIDSILPDVVLIDITMPNLTGLEAMGELKKSNPNLAFIVLTMHEEPEYILKSIQNGASGYLLKSVEYEELATAIKTVANGGKYFNTFVSGILIENLNKPDLKSSTPTLSLTERELEVLRWVAEGLSTKLIADKLNIGTRTVETHRLNLLKKLQVSNTAELVKKAFEQNLIT